MLNGFRRVKSEAAIKGEPARETSWLKPPGIQHPHTHVMELRHLRYFVAVADEMSVTKAAKLLRLAQPSLTRQIKNLEEELHVILFHRAKKRLELTEDGQFLPGARSSPA